MILSNKQYYFFSNACTMDVQGVLIRALEAGLEELQAKLYHGNVSLLITLEANEVRSE
jgi:hypothetical protein